VVANYISRDQRCGDAHREQVRISPSCKIFEASRTQGQSCYTSTTLRSSKITRSIVVNTSSDSEVEVAVYTYSSSLVLVDQSTSRALVYAPINTIWVRIRNITLGSKQCTIKTFRVNFSRSKPLSCKQRVISSSEARQSYLTETCQ